MGTLGNDETGQMSVATDSVGQRVRLRRKELGLTQVQLSALSGMRQSTISDLERGRNKSTIELVVLATALECSPEWLRSGDPQQLDGDRLRDLFDRLKAETGMSRAAFAVKHGIPGGDAMIYQHIVGLKPISMDAGIAYAKGFGVSLSDISPRLDGEASKVAASHQFLSHAQNDALNLISTMTGEQAQLWLAIGRTIQAH